MTGWVATWAAAPQPAAPDALPPPPFTAGGRVLAGCTLRQTIAVSRGGRRLRLRFSNAYGSADLLLDRVRVALPRGGRAGVFPTVPGTSRAVTFGGRPAVSVPAGAQAVSDPLEYPLPARAVLTVTACLPAGQDARGVTVHPGSRTTSYLVAGDHAGDGTGAGDDTGRAVAVPVEHWYFLSGAEVSVRDAGALVALGDSLTDGRGSTTNGNDRWPDQLFARLYPRGPAIVNQGIGGNRLLRDGAGPSALARLDRDVLAVSGVRWLVVFEGVNDIGTAAPPAAREQEADRLIWGYEQIITRAHAAGISVLGATLTPFGGNEPYDDPGGYREAARQAVNAWIRGGGRPGGSRFDGVLDFDRAVRDPRDRRRLRPEADSGDHLHLNPRGYRALAEAVPARYLGCEPEEPERKTGVA